MWIFFLRGKNDCQCLSIFGTLIIEEDARGLFPSGLLISEFMFFLRVRGLSRS